MIPTSEDVAGFMVEQVHARQRLTTSEMTALIAERFGEGIEMDHPIQARFRRLHAGSIRWVERGAYWERVS